MLLLLVMMWQTMCTCVQRVLASMHAHINLDKNSLQAHFKHTWQIVRVGPQSCPFFLLAACAVHARCFL